MISESSETSTENPESLASSDSAYGSMVSSGKDNY